MAPADHHHLVARRRRRPDLTARPAAPAAAQQHGGSRGPSGTGARAAAGTGSGGRARGIPPRGAGPRAERAPPVGGGRPWRAASAGGGPARRPGGCERPERGRAAAVLACPRPAGRWGRPGAGNRSEGAGGRRAAPSRLGLDRRDASDASALVNQVVPQLTQAPRSRDGGFSSIQRLGAGSYYEHVEIPEPSEFGIMLVMPVEKDSQLDECDDIGKSILLKFLDEDGKLVLFFSKAFRNIVAKYLAGSPAITLLIKNPASEISVDITLTLEAQQSWPPNTQDGLKIEQWLGRKVKGEFRKKKSPYLVQDPLFLILWNGNTWRLSFSHIEKAMMNNHGSSKTCCESDGLKCCRKGCLKLLKYLLEELKMKYTKKLAKFFSYHVKTAFFHSCVMWPKDTDWHWADLDHCFWKYLGYFLECLQNTQLPHFFIPKYSLLSLEDKVSSDFLSRQINDQLNNRFPVFQESLKKKIIVYNK
uniref:Cyclic GMP-AMP synthase n=1 Tax=Falco tinnunculus TaxID=100819 RepID=A0A8C4VGZ2_FALTI